MLSPAFSFLLLLLLLLRTVARDILGGYVCVRKKRRCVQNVVEGIERYLAGHMPCRMAHLELAVNGITIRASRLRWSVLVRCHRRMQ
ncbi:hypothetical protein GGS23DRAFT_560883 [Durotheca rogersii]|uniref:uncharacterized protein n=1 Tax=Durotheca rogersii TaxID=419775 RepID=UPI00221E46E2|nr:uncharacterized protein GGS23DRAFT_560883 [Durotheca rogersii]KAI5864589.1 hypothetical protein GGS23DRAFT_560883 [Durotheca rogersii]